MMQGASMSSTASASSVPAVQSTVAVADAGMAAPSQDADGSIDADDAGPARTRTYPGPCTSIASDNRGPIERATFAYDDQGNQIASTGGPADGSSVYNRSKTRYDSDGHIVLVEDDVDGDGKVTARVTYAYDDQGRLSSRQLTSAGDWAQCESYRYDAAGRVGVIESDSSCDADIDQRSTHHYDARGLLSSIETHLADGTLWYVDSYTYDDQGRKIRAEYDGNADGIAGSVTTYAYDDADNLRTEALDSDADGTANVTVVYNYDCWSAGAMPSTSSQGGYNGDACTKADECRSGVCEDGVCCETGCGGDCAVCTAFGDCQLQHFGSVCRARQGDCDTEETCDGWSPNCPADQVAPSNSACRRTSGACDAVEQCDGIHKSCPVDVHQPAGTVCRPSVSRCDAAEVCTGTSAECPANALGMCPRP
jgi:YD repeat-containing protein